MAELPSHLIAEQVDRTVREVMHDVVVPDIKLRVDNLIMDTVHIAINNMYRNTSFLQDEISKAVKDIIMNRIHVRISIDADS